MPSVNQIYPSTYLKADDIPTGQYVKLVIKDAQVKTLGQGDEAERKLVLTFKGTDKQLPLNKTNALAIAEVHGDESDDWLGGDIWVYRDTVTAFGKRQEVVRLTAKQPAAWVPKDKRQPAPQPAPKHEPEVDFSRHATTGNADNLFDDDDPDKDIPF